MFRGHTLRTPLGPDDPDRGAQEIFSTTWHGVKTSEGLVF